MSARNHRWASPQIAVGPRPANWAAAAIRRGGGEVVTLDHKPMGLVWTNGTMTESLREVLTAHPEISWVQLPQAGVETVAEAGVIDRRRQWTWAKGAYAEPVAEHALALLLAGLRQLPVRARARSWGEPAAVSLFDQPVTVIGGGGVATALLRLLEPFRVQATVVRQRPEPLAGATRTISAGRLPEALAGARAVVLTLALTPRTRRLISQAELAAMERDAWLVNVARGGLVDTGALVDALDLGSPPLPSVSGSSPASCPSSYSPTGEGKFFFTMMAAFAELERDIIHERTMAGLAAAKAQGRTGGRPTVMDADKLAAARARRARGESPTEIARALGVSRWFTGTWAPPTSEPA